MTEITEKDDVVVPNELKYENRVIKGVSYKVLVDPFPYRLGKTIMSYLETIIDPKTNQYNFGTKEVAELAELILCSLVSEPKVDSEYLMSDKCPIEFMAYGNYLFKKVMSSNAIKEMTGLEFEDTPAEETIEIEDEDED